MAPCVPVDVARPAADVLRMSNLDYADFVERRAHLAREALEAELDRKASEARSAAEEEMKRRVGEARARSDADMRAKLEDYRELLLQEKREKDEAEEEKAREAMLAEVGAVQEAARAEVEAALKARVRAEATEVAARLQAQAEAAKAEAALQVASMTAIMDDSDDEGCRTPADIEEQYAFGEESVARLAEGAVPQRELQTRVQQALMEASERQMARQPPQPRPLGQRRHARTETEIQDEIRRALSESRARQGAPRGTAARTTGDVRSHISAVMTHIDDRWERLLKAQVTKALCGAFGRHAPQDERVEVPDDLVQERIQEALAAAAARKPEHRIEEARAAAAARCSPEQQIEEAQVAAEVFRGNPFAVPEPEPEAPAGLELSTELAPGVWSDHQDVDGLWEEPAEQPWQSEDWCAAGLLKPRSPRKVRAGELLAEKIRGALCAQQQHPDECSADVKGHEECSAKVKDREESKSPRKWGGC